MYNAQQAEMWFGRKHLVSLAAKKSGLNPFHGWVESVSNEGVTVRVYHGEGDDAVFIPFTELGHKKAPWRDIGQMEF